MLTVGDLEHPRVLGSGPDPERTQERGPVYGSGCSPLYESLALVTHDCSDNASSWYLHSLRPRPSYAFHFDETIGKLLEAKSDTAFAKVCQSQGFGIAMNSLVSLF